MGGRGSSSASSIYTASVSKSLESETPSGLSAAQQAVIDDYVADKNGEVGLVRAVQQGKNVGAEQEKYKEMGEIMESMIAQNKSEYDTIYRGIRVPEAELSQYTEGYVFDQKGTSSWSGADGMALRYAYRNDIAGLPVMFISYWGKNAAPIGQYSSLNEDEWLVSKNQKFRVTWVGDVIPQGYQQKVRIIEVEEV